MTAPVLVREPPNPALIGALRQRLGDRLSTSAAVCDQHGKDESYHQPHSPDAVAFARSSPAPDNTEAFFGVYAGDRDEGNPVHRIEARERDEMLPFAPQVGPGSQGSGH